MWEGWCQLALCKGACLNECFKIEIVGSTVFKIVARGQLQRNQQLYVKERYVLQQKPKHEKRCAKWKVSIKLLNAFVLFYINIGVSVKELKRIVFLVIKIHK